MQGNCAMNSFAMLCNVWLIDSKNVVYLALFRGKLWRGCYISIAFASYRFVGTKIAFALPNRQRNIQKELRHCQILYFRALHDTMIQTKFEVK